SLGFQTIYRLANAHPDVAAERAFLPDDVDAHRRTRTPPFSLESQTPLGAFSVLAFSVAFELEVTGLLTLLDVAGLPPLREDRTDAHPLIVAGGPLTFASPEPLEPFVDLLVQGEAEHLVPQLLEG